MASGAVVPPTPSGTEPRRPLARTRRRSSSGQSGLCACPGCATTCPSARDPADPSSPPAGVAYAAPASRHRGMCHGATPRPGAWSLLPATHPHRAHWSVPVAPGACIVLASMTTKRRPAGRVSTGGMGRIRRRSAVTHGPQARKRAATAWSVMDSDRAVQVPATARQGGSHPQEKKTTRKRCAGVLTFVALTKAVQARAICTVSEGRSCKSASKSVSGSVRGNCMDTSPVGSRGNVVPHAVCPHLL